MMKSFQSSRLTTIKHPAFLVVPLLKCPLLKEEKKISLENDELKQSHEESFPVYFGDFSLSGEH